ncbi:hypothetical protein FB157_111107 [Streptomyces sp. BK340]|nr:hypothetical protein FB157_111107 [Streptomyces sp. BK340]
MRGLPCKHGFRLLEHGLLAVRRSSTAAAAGVLADIGLVAVGAAALTIIGGAATLAGALTSLAFTGLAARIVWVVVGCVVAALLGVFCDHLTTLLIRRTHARLLEQGKTSGGGEA